MILASRKVDAGQQVADDIKAGGAKVTVVAECERSDSSPAAVSREFCRLVHPISIEASVRAGA